jgi:hypothetical protein
LAFVVKHAKASKLGVFGSKDFDEPPNKLHYGSRHFDDGTATATCWVTLLWLPIIPLRKSRLRVLTDFRRALRGDAPGQIALRNGCVIQEDRFELVEKLPLSPRDIARTLVKAYVVLPLLLLCPPVFSGRSSSRCGGQGVGSSIEARRVRPSILGAAGTSLPTRSRSRASARVAAAAPALGTARAVIFVVV